MEILLGWFVFSIIAGIIAGTKNRNGFGYFLLSLALSPLVGLILAIALPGLAAAGTPAGPTPATHIKCPDCRELVLKDARKCKHCGSQLVPIDPNAIRCPSCGDIGKISEKYCASCGHNLH